MLKQSTAFGPFVRQFLVLAKIAVFTGNDDIANVVSSATYQWNNMVDVPFLTYGLMTIIAFSVLPFELIKYLFTRVASCCVPFSRAPIVFNNTMRQFPAFASTIFSMPLSYFLGVSLFVTPYASLMGIWIFCILSPFDSAVFFGILLFPSAFIIAFAGTAIVIKPILLIRLASEVTSVSLYPLFAFPTLFVGDRLVDHDVFLSSYSMMLSASGGISRRFGLQSLADNSIIPQVRYV